MTGWAEWIARLLAPLGLATIALASPAVSSAGAASSAGVENGVLVVRDEQPSLAVTVAQSAGGVLVQFGGDGYPLPGAGCTTVPEGIECAGVSAIEVFDRDEFLDRNPLGRWVFERIQLNVPLPVTVHGRAGREWVTHESAAAEVDGEETDLASPVTLDGGAQEDLLQGGAGADTLTGGPGVDLLRGRAGDDHIFARDGEKDSISCGPGFDTVEADADEQWNPAPEYWCEVINGRRAVNGRPPASDGSIQKPPATPGRCARMRARHVRAAFESAAVGAPRGTVTSTARASGASPASRRRDDPTPQDTRECSPAQVGEWTRRCIGASLGDRRSCHVRQLRFVSLPP